MENTDFTPITSADEFNAAIEPLKKAWEGNFAAEYTKNAAEKTIGFLKSNGFDVKPSEKYYQATERIITELKQKADTLAKDVETYKSTAGEGMEKYKGELETYKHLLSEKEKQFMEALKAKESEIFSEKMQFKVDKKMASIGIDEKAISADPIKKMAYDAVRKSLFDGVAFKEHDGQMVLADANGNVVIENAKITTLEDYVAKKMAMFVDNGNPNKGLGNAKVATPTGGFADDQYGFIPSEKARQDKGAFITELDNHLRTKGIVGYDALNARQTLFAKAFPSPTTK